MTVRLFRWSCLAAGYLLLHTAMMIFILMVLLEGRDGVVVGRRSFSFESALDKQVRSACVARRMRNLLLSLTSIVKVLDFVAFFEIVLVMLFIEFYLNVAVTLTTVVLGLYMLVYFFGWKRLTRLLLSQVIGNIYIDVLVRIQHPYLIIIELKISKVPP